MDALLAAADLILLTMLDGRDVLINPAQITQLRESRPEGHPDKLLADPVRCVIRLTDGTYVTVAVTCDVVRDKIEGAK